MGLGRQVPATAQALEWAMQRGQGGVTFPVSPYMTSSAAGVTVVARELDLCRGYVTRSWPLRSIDFYVATNAGSDDACFVSLYDRNGNKLAESALTSGKLNGGTPSVVLTADYQVQPWTVYYAGFLCPAIGTTPAKLGNAVSTGAHVVKMFGVQPGFIETDYQTAQDTLPATFAGAGGNSSVPVLMLRETSNRFVAFGDSGSTNPAWTTSYPYALAQKLGPYSRAISGGVGGDTTTDMAARIAGVTAERPHSVLVLGGLNDIIGDATAETIEGNLGTIYTTLAAAGITVYPVCLTPWGGHASYTGDREAVRLAVNTWIRAQAYTYADATATLGDGATPPALQAGYDSGDHLHPNAAGMVALAGAVFTQAFNSTQSPRP